MGGTKFFLLKRNVILWVEVSNGVKSKDIVPRVGPSQRAENM
jgi:hypothetical protein